MFFSKKSFFFKIRIWSKIAQKWFKMILLSFFRSDPKDDLHPFVDDFWPFKILTFSTFFCWKIGYNTNATRADFFENLAFFAWFFFWPHPYFGGKQTKCQKKITKVSQSPKISTKKSLVTPEQKMSEKIQKVEPPPKPPLLGGGVFLKSSVVFKRDLACWS